METAPADGDGGLPHAEKRQKVCHPAPAATGRGSEPARPLRPCAPDAPDEEFASWVVQALEGTGDFAADASAEERLLLPAEFALFKFTGPLRPALVTPKMRPPSGCSLPDYAVHPKGASREEVRARKAKVIPELKGEELEAMREACRLGREVLDVASRFLRAGVTGDEVDRVVWQACADRGLYPSPLGYYGFPKSVCISPNEVICHGIPNCRPLQEGDIVNLDISVCHNGFHADLNETFFLGECDEESHLVVRTAYEALQVAASIIRPGTMYRTLGNKIQAEAAKKGCAVVPNFCGHGVGRLFHGLPDIPHYAKNKAVGIMKPGHVFTVEPMINLGSSGKERMWPDGWTAATRSGKRSAQFEHAFLVTEDGFEVLTARPGTDRAAMPDYDPALLQR